MELADRPGVSLSGLLTPGVLQVSLTDASCGNLATSRDACMLQSTQSNSCHVTFYTDGYQ